MTKILNMRAANTIFISISPNKSNIKLVVKKVDNAVETSMFWIIDSLEQLKSNFPKTLVYANSISDVSKLYTYVASELPSCVRHIQMFHSETPEEKKKTIIQALCEKESDIRIVFATTALGMGIDVVDCHSIILYGPPRSVLDLVQEVGRIGRDNITSAAILMHNSYHLRQVSAEVKAVFGTKCRRQVLMSYFLTESELDKLSSESNKHTCCDICAKNCTCGSCEQLKIEKLVENIDVEGLSDTSNSHDSDTEEYEHELIPTCTGDAADSDDGSFDDLDENV